MSHPVPDEVSRIQAMLSEANLTSASLGQMYDSLMNLFNAACVVNDTSGMENLREQIHGVIDNILDSNATIYMLTRQLMGAIGRG